MERERAPQVGDWEGHAKVWGECRDWLRSHGKGPHRDTQIAVLEGALLVIDPGVEPERIRKHMVRHGIGATTGADRENSPGRIEGARFAGLYAIAAGSDNAEVLAMMDNESPDGIDAATRQRALAMASENGAVKAIEHLAPRVGRQEINTPAAGIDPHDSAHVLEHAGKARTYRQARTVEELLRNGASYEEISKGQQESEHRIIEAAGLGLANTVERLAPRVGARVLGRAMEAAASQREQHDDDTFERIIEVLRRHGARAVEAQESKGRIEQIAERISRHREHHPQGKLTLLWRGAGWDIAWAEGRGNRRSGHIAASGLRDTEVEGIMSELGLARTPRQREKLARDLDSIRNEHRSTDRAMDQGRGMR